MGAAPTTCSVTVNRSTDELRLRMLFIFNMFGRVIQNRTEAKSFGGSCATTTPSPYVDGFVYLYRHSTDATHRQSTDLSMVVCMSLTFPHCDLKITCRNRWGLSPHRTTTHIKTNRSLPITVYQSPWGVTYSPLLLSYRAEASFVSLFVKVKAPTFMSALGCFCFTNLL